MNVSGEPKTAAEVIDSKRVLVIGHRGFCHLAPENTLPSFRLSLEAGADLIELDYRHSKDGVPVVIHDPELNRTTDASVRFRNRHVRVASKTASEIEALDAGQWFDARFAGTRVPLLEATLKLICASGVALIERKAGDPAALVTLLRHSGFIDKVVVQSFDWEFLRRIHEQEPKLILGALGPAKHLPNGKKPLGISRKLNRAWLRWIPSTGACVVVWSQPISHGAVQLAHHHGLKVWVYTVNQEKHAKRLLRAGVDGIITNDAHLIHATVAKPSLNWI